ncbi:MAG: MAC/perforin domain-containing protein, partial [Pseudomonadota bacterium]
FDAVGDAAYGERLLLDYTAGGELRIRLGRRQFLRPDPAISSDLAIDDAFVIQFQTDNFAANLKGYNVLTQDPFLLMNNNLGEVFARRDREEYRIQEKYAVPFGFTLRNETLQGNVYRRTILSSERQIQEANRTSLGLNANVSVSGAVNSALAFVPGTGEIADTGFSVGNQNSRETMRAMQSSQTVAQVVGYSRAKSYAIVAQHADTELSGDFITAVFDAKNDGDYSAIINRFGTHYAYAVTYGASAKMTQDISEEAFSTVLSESEGERQDAELRVLGSSLGMFNESMRSGLNGTSGQLSNEGGRFVAIGGNGSWDAGGYAKGDRVAPILVDLRPLDELLNPINFPDQPEIYTRVRLELAQSINQYLARQARPLSNERIISKVAYVPPAPEPAPIVQEGPDIEEWLVYVRHMDCRKPKLGTTTSASGDITISAVGPSNAFSQPRTLSVGCKYKE